jgi:hypothetical protein
LEPVSGILDSVKNFFQGEFTPVTFFMNRFR